MESIDELRRICQNTRPAIYSDFLSRWYYKASIYFTWLCIKMRMSANQVTVLSGVIAVIGGILLISDSKLLVFLGALFFHLFAILDMSDGEVARYRKQGGVAGHYLDWYMHFISSTALVAGLYLSSIQSNDSIWLTGIGLLAVITPILAKTVQNSGWTVICWTRLRDIKNNIEVECGEHSDDVADKSPRKQPFIIRRLRFLVLSPLQDHWLPVVLVLIAGLDIILYWAGIGFVDYRLLLLLYIGIVGPIHIYMNVRRIVQSNALTDGYKRLVCESRIVNLPEDDFLS